MRYQRNASAAANDVYVGTPEFDPRAPPRQVDFEAIFAERARRRESLLALPGIEAVAFGGGFPGVPLRPVLGLWSALDDPEPAQMIQFPILSIDDGYVELLRLEMISGRNLIEHASEGVLVNETFARTLFGRVDVVGEPLPIPLGWLEQSDIVGVLRDVSFEHPTDEIRPQAFVAGHMSSDSDPILIRTSMMTAAELRDLLLELSASGELDFEITDILRLSDLTDRDIAPDRAVVVVAWLRDDFVSSAVSPSAVALLVLAGMAGVLLASSLGPAKQAQRTAPASLLREA